MPRQDIHREARLDARCRHREKAEIRAAATLAEVTISELVRDATLAEARRILRGGREAR